MKKSEKTPTLFDKIIKKFKIVQYVVSFYVAAWGSGTVYCPDPDPESHNYTDPTGSRSTTLVKGCVEMPDIIEHGSSPRPRNLGLI